MISFPSSLCLADFPCGRGVAVTRAVQRGEVLLTVPLAQCWTAASARRRLEVPVAMTEKEAIIAELMVLKDSDEKSSHVALLPSLESMNLPPFWKESDLAELEGSEVHTHAIRLQEELQEDFETLQQKLLGCEIKASFKTFQWAWSIYSSRVMSLTTDTGSIFAIVPGLDMFNHSPTVSPGLFQLCDDVVQVKAGEVLTTGQQAYINYAADMYNSQMLLSFGFILDDPNLQSSEITLSLQVSQAQLEVHRLVLDALEGPLFQILHLPSDAKNSELIVKHILTCKDPLPAAFLSMVRIQHLQDLPSKSAMELALNGLQSKDELRALFLISMLLEGKLQGLQRSEHDHPTSRQELAWKQCHGERLVLQAALDEAKKMQMKSIQKALVKVTSTDGHCDDEDCEKAQTPWLHRLRRASKQLTADVSSVARLSKNLCDRLPVAHLIQSCHILNLWLVDRHAHKLLQRLCFASETWPFVVSNSCNIETLALPNCGSGGGGYPNSSMDGSSKDKNSYLSLYHEKMKLWGSWLTAQWIHAEAIQMDELSSMGHEQVNLRNAHAWSVPTEKALKLIASYAPLLELGAGTGYWASQLVEFATDILVFDEKHFQSSFNDQTQISEGQEISARYFCQVQQGGPEIANKYADRTLLLMWPDYMGYGTYGLQCLQHYQGNTLILIGEWKNSTFGSYAQGISEHGQSFSLDFQEKVEAEFELIEILDLPTWPLFLDRLQIFRRRNTQKKRRFRKRCIFLKGLGPTETVVILHK